MKKQLILLILLAFAKGYTSEVEHFGQKPTSSTPEKFCEYSDIVEVDEPVDNFKISIDDQTRATLTTEYLTYCDAIIKINEKLLQVTAKDEKLPFVHPVEAYQYVLHGDKRLFNPGVVSLSFRLDKTVVQKWLLNNDSTNDKFDQQFSNNLEDLEKYGYEKLEHLPPNIALILLYTFGKIKPEQTSTIDGQKRSMIRATFKKIREIVAPNLSPKEYYGAE